MGDLLVVTGPPGAGKSTVAALLAEHGHRSALVPGDDFFGFLRRGAIPPWLPESHEQNVAVVEAAAAASGRLVGHCDVVYDGVVGPWLLPAFLDRSGLDHLDYAVLLPPLDVCLHRVRTRTGHPFADLEAAEHMWRDFHDAAIEGRHLLTDVVPLVELTRLVVERRLSGSLRYPAHCSGVGH
ncbi:MAG TPA: AAA family ATPase [Marmoricola sp.]